MGLLKRLLKGNDHEKRSRRHGKRIRSDHPDKPEAAFKEYPPGIRAELLLRASGAIDDFASSQRYSRHADKIFGRLTQRNLEGRKLEKAGQLDKAIKLYEANVADFFVGEHPYERLRIIYRRTQDYDKALSVCNSYVAMDDLYQQVVSRKQQSRNEKRQHFEKWCTKLEAQLSRQGDG